MKKVGDRVVVLGEQQTAQRGLGERGEVLVRARLELQRTAWSPPTRSRQGRGQVILPSESTGPFCSPSPHGRRTRLSLLLRHLFIMPLIFRKLDALRKRRTLLPQ